MITRQVKLISAALLIALFVLAHSAGAAVISYSPTDYTIFAGGDLTVGVTSGVGSHIGGMVGAGGDVTIGDYARISDLGGYAGSVFANDDVTIGDNSYITGRVLADNAVGGGGTHGVVIGDYSAVEGRIDAGGEAFVKANIDIGNSSRAGGTVYAAANVTLGTNVDIGASGNAQNINAAKSVTIGTGSVVWGNVDLPKTKKLTNNGTIVGSTGNTPTAPDSFTYTLRTAPTFDTSGSVSPDITVDAELAPGTYLNLTVQPGVTLTVSAGTYDFQNIILEDGANISIRSDTNPADVIIQAFEGLFTTGNNVLGRVGQAQLVFNIGDLLTIGSGSTVAGSLLAYGDTSEVNIGSNSTILGKVYSAGDVIIGDNVLVSKSGSVPEPGTLVLLGLGAACMLVRRRRRGNRA